MTVCIKNGCMKGRFTNNVDFAEVEIPFYSHIKVFGLLFGSLKHILSLEGEAIK